VDTVGALDADAILVTPDWGWNMAAEPMAHVRAVAQTLLGAGATLVAGHSAHVFHGITPHALYDLGDFLDDDRVDRELRNDLGLLFLVDLAISRLEAIPLKRAHALCRRPRRGLDPASVRRRLRGVREGRDGRKTAG
jgi:hypothetical protein